MTWRRRRRQYKSLCHIVFIRWINVENVRRSFTLNTLTSTIFVCVKQSRSNRCVEHCVDTTHISIDITFYGIQQPLLIVI